VKRLDHLLWIAGEEGCEVAQRASKAARFGMDEIQPGQALTNYQRIWQEFADLYAAMMMLSEEHADGVIIEDFWEMVEAKKAKVEKFLLYSAECGTLTTNPDAEAKE